MNTKSFIALLLCCGLVTMGTAQCPTTSIILDSQADIDNFSTNYPGCTMIPANVNVTINDEVSGNITNLDGLSQIASIEGFLAISYNEALTNLDGLSQISSIGRFLSIEYNEALTNLDGLSQISYIGESIWIIYNNILTNLDGLSQIASVGENLSIQGNTALSNLDGLSQITSIEKSLFIGNSPALTNLDELSQISSIGGNIRIDNNPALSNLNGLSQISFIGESLIIDNNPALSNLDGLSQISSIGNNLWITNNVALSNLDGLSQISSIGASLRITHNSVLTNLNGLSQISSIEESLWILGNAQLNQCCAVCPLLAADAANPTVIGGNILILDNLFGCNSATEITECTPCGLVNTSTPEYAPTQINIYPNPANNILHFQYASSEGEFVHFTIENHLGQQVIQSQAYTNQLVQVDISGYPAGLYSLTVLREGESISELFSVAR